MATNTLIQKLFGVDEVASSDDLGQGSSVISNRRQVERFLADGTIAEGAPVVFDAVDGGSGEVVMKVVESAADGPAIGVALSDASSGDYLDVVISGMCEALVKGTNNAGNAAISAGEYICQGDVAGEFYKFTAGTDATPHAIIVDDVGSGDAAALKTIIVLKQF